MAKAKTLANQNLGKIQVQETTNRQKTCCSNCGDLPQGTRLIQIKGSGKWQKSIVYCQDCGAEFLETVRERIEDLDLALGGEEGHEEAD